MINIIYDSKFGTPIPDGLVEPTFKHIIEDYGGHDKNISLSFSTENIILRFRVAIKNKEIGLGRIRFKFATEFHGLMDLNINDYGRFEYWPNGFCDSIERFLEQLL